jgi:hypothetical protein
MNNNTTNPTNFGNFHFHPFLDSAVPLEETWSKTNSDSSIFSLDFGNEDPFEFAPDPEIMKAAPLSEDQCPSSFDLMMDDVDEFDLSSIDLPTAFSSLSTSFDQMDEVDESDSSSTDLLTIAAPTPPPTFCMRVKDRIIEKISKEPTASCNVEGAALCTHMIIYTMQALGACRICAMDSHKNNALSGKILKGFKTPTWNHIDTTRIKGSELQKQLGSESFSFSQVKEGSVVLSKEALEEWNAGEGEQKVKDRVKKCDERRAAGVDCRAFSKAEKDAARRKAKRQEKNAAQAKRDEKGDLQQQAGPAKRQKS